MTNTSNTSDTISKIRRLPYLKHSTRSRLIARLSDPKHTHARHAQPVPPSLNFDQFARAHRLDTHTIAFVKIKNNNPGTPIAPAALYHTVRAPRRLSSSAFNRYRQSQGTHFHGLPQYIIALADSRVAALYKVKSWHPASANPAQFPVEAAHHPTHLYFEQATPADTPADPVMTTLSTLLRPSASLTDPQLTTRCPFIYWPYRTHPTA